MITMITFEYSTRNAVVIGHNPLAAAKFPSRTRLSGHPFPRFAIAFNSPVGLFSGFNPAWRASHFDPIEALRYE